MVISYPIDPVHMAVAVNSISMIVVMRCPPGYGLLMTYSGRKLSRGNDDDIRVHEAASAAYTIPFLVEWKKRAVFG